MDIAENFRKIDHSIIAFMDSLSKAMETNEEPNCGHLENAITLAKSMSDEISAMYRIANEEMNPQPVMNALTNVIIIHQSLQITERLGALMSRMYYDYVEHMKKQGVALPLINELQCHLNQIIVDTDDFCEKWKTVGASFC